MQPQLPSRSVGSIITMKAAPLPYGSSCRLAGPSKTRTTAAIRRASATTRCASRTASATATAARASAPDPASTATRTRLARRGRAATGRRAARLDRRLLRAAATAPGAEPATYMDEYDGLCMLIIIYLVCSAMVGIVGCVCAKQSGHWAGRTLAEAPDAVPVSDIEATTIANPLLPSEETPSAPQAPEPAPAPSARPVGPMFTDTAGVSPTRRRLSSRRQTRTRTAVEGMAVEPMAVSARKPADDAPPAYVEQPALIPEGQPAEAVPVGGAGRGRRLRPGLRSDSRI